MKNALLGFLSIVVAVTGIALLGEALLRANQFYLVNIAGERNYQVLVIDEKLGWLPAPNYSYVGELLDSAGVAYPVDISTNAEGFRLYGDPQESRKPKVLFLGDSFTHAMHVSNDKTYYGILGNSLDLEVFSLGVEGYGTLQESMLLDQYIDVIAPDVVVLQFCGNDVINNSYELELRSRHNSNRLRRPYFDGNQISYATPTQFPAIRDFANNYSRFLYFILARVDRVTASLDASAEQAMWQQSRADPLYDEAIEISGQLIDRIARRIPATTPVIAFSSDHGGLTAYEEFRRYSQANGFQFVEDVSSALRTESGKTGVVTTAADGAHWNNRGHAIVAAALRPHLAALTD